MSEFVQLVWLFMGLVCAQVADPSSPCEVGACVSVPERSAVALSVPRTVRPDEVRLFSRSDRRPGLPGEALDVPRPPDFEVIFVPPAAERMREFERSRMVSDVGIPRSAHVEIHTRRGHRFH